MRKNGFTLIELLVVIAIIGVLTSVLIPSLLMVKYQTRSIECGSNVYQLSLGLRIYLQEYNSFPYGFWDLDLVNPPFIPPEGHAGYATHDRQGLWWFNYLQLVMEFDSSDDESVVWCPSRKFVEFADRENMLCENYGANRSVFKDARKIAGCKFVGEPLRINELRSPSKTLLLSDSGYSLVSWLAATETTEQVFENFKRVGAFYIPGLELNQTRSELIDNPDAIKGRHPHKTLNVGFADGHTEVRNAESLSIDSTAAENGHISALWIP